MPPISQFVSKVAKAAGSGPVDPARMKELARLANQPPPAPPPLPPPPRPAQTTQRRHPMQDAWDRQFHEFSKRSGGVAPPDEGYVRLYRAGKVPKDSPPRAGGDLVALPWGTDVTRRQLDEMQGGNHSSPLGAEGRWFTDDPKQLDTYVVENDTSPIYYVDVPADYAAANNVAKTPFLKNSRNPDREFVLPEPAANQAVRLLDGLKDRR